MNKIVFPLRQCCLWSWLLLVLLGSSSLLAQTNVSYTADNSTIFPSPERGMWMHRVTAWIGESYMPLSKDELIREGRQKNRTVVHARYVIDEYRGTDQLGARLLDQFRNDLRACREAGMKMVPLFMYNHGNIEGEGYDDAPQARILKHLDQLGAVMKDNGDVIAYWAGGFVGRWGEWHNSSNDIWGNCIGDISAGGKAVITKMFEVVPNNRAVVFRLTAYMKSMFGTQPLTSSEAFTGSNKSRAGFKNHYFMGINNGNEGWCTITRASNGVCDWDCSEAAIVRERNYIHQQGSYTPVEAEPDTDVNPATDPRHAGHLAIEQMKLQRISLCNPVYNINILNRWKADGVYDEIERNLGYRYQLVQAVLPTQAVAGSTAAVSFTVRNTGYAAAYNPRDMEVVLRSASTVRRLKVNADPRRWLPENGNIQVNQTIALPADLPAGNYEVLLNLPDPMASLNTRPEYSIRLANQNLWEPTTGYNKLNHTLTVTGGPPPAATYYRVKSRWQGTYLYDNGDQLGYGTGSTSAYQWSVENAGGFTQLKNRATGEYLNIEMNKDYVECTVVNSGWWSKDWIVEDYDGHKMIRNRWQSDQYIHIENLKGYAQHTAIAKGTWSSQWLLESVNSARLSADQTVASTVQLSPNPATESITLTLQAKQAQTVVVNIVNGKGASIGQLRKAIQAGKQQVVLPLVRYKKGLYLIQLTVDGQRHVKKLVVE